MYTYKLINPEKEATADGGAVLRFSLEIYQDDKLLKSISNERISEPSTLGKYAQDVLDKYNAPFEQQDKIDKFLVAPPVSVSMAKTISLQDKAKQDYDEAKNKLRQLSDEVNLKIITADDKEYTDALADVKNKKAAL